MQHDVLEHEEANLSLQCAIIHLGKRIGTARITTQLDMYGGFSADVLSHHTTFALNRCRLENLVGHKNNDVLERCHVIVGTLGGLGNKSILKQLKVMPGDRCFGVISHD